MSMTLFDIIGVECKGDKSMSDDFGNWPAIRIWPGIVDSYFVEDP